MSNLSDVLSTKSYPVKPLMDWHDTAERNEAVTAFLMDISFEKLMEDVEKSNYSSLPMEHLPRMLLWLYASEINQKIHEFNVNYSRTKNGFNDLVY